MILGPLGIIGAGPLAAVLLAAGGAGFYGAIAGLLTGRDVNAPLVEALEQAIQAGKILVSVDDSDGKTTEQVRAVLAQCQPFECLEI